MNIFLAYLITGVARLSSARVVRFLVNSFNERNSYLLFYIIYEFFDIYTKETVNYKLKEGKN